MNTKTIFHLLSTHYNNLCHLFHPTVFIDIAFGINSFIFVVSNHLKILFNNIIYQNKIE